MALVERDSNGGAMTVDFLPIKVTACDESRVRRASGSKDRYVVPFSLSSKPSRDWEDIFDDVWRTYRKSSSKPKAQAYVRKGEMIVECVLSDVKQVFPNVRVLIDAANDKFSSQLKQRAEKNEKKRRKREEEKLAEKRAINEALGGLDFS
jgi:hypothetical protein